MARISDLNTPHATAKHDDRGDASEKHSNQPDQPERPQNMHQVIEDLIPRLTRYARVLTRDLAAADDLVQECLTRALGKMHLWEQGTDLRAWLFTILHHIHISQTRRNARQRASMELQKSHRSSAQSPNQTVRLELRDLERALAKLPEEQRLVILLVGLEGLSYAETAEVLEIPVGTVMSRLARGRDRLRSLMDYDGDKNGRAALRRVK